MVRPHMDFTYHSISSHTNTLYVLRTKPGVQHPTRQDDLGTEVADTPLKLKGEMILVPEADCILFEASPVVLSLDDLNRRGNYFLYTQEPGICTKVSIIMPCNVR